jgi:hypothetical protein
MGSPRRVMIDILRRMGASAAPRGTPVADRRGLPVIVALAIAVVLLGGCVVIAALFGYHHGVWALRATFGMLRVGEGMAGVGCALSVLAAALTRPPLTYRGFVASLSSAVTGAFIVGMTMWWHAMVTRRG